MSDKNNEWVKNTVNKLTCNDYLLKYKKCVSESNGKNTKLRECNKIMNNFRYCLMDA